MFEGMIVDSNTKARLEQLVEDGVVELSDNLPPDNKLDIKFTMSKDEEEPEVGKRGHHNNMVNYTGKRSRFYR